MSGGKTSNHCSGNSSFDFSAHMTGHASVDARNAGTGDNHCNQDGSSKGGSGSASVTVPALLNLQSGNIDINPHMFDGSSFTGGPMVTGNGNGFSLQNLNTYVNGNGVNYGAGFQAGQNTYIRGNGDNIRLQNLNQYISGNGDNIVAPAGETVYIHGTGDSVHQGLQQLAGSMYISGDNDHIQIPAGDRII